MRIQVIANKSGKIVAAVQLPAATDRVQYGLSPLKGQKTATLDAPEHLRHLESHERLQTIFTYSLHPNGKALVAPRSKKVKG